MFLSKQISHVYQIINTILLEILFLSMLIIKPDRVYKTVNIYKTDNISKTDNIYKTDNVYMQKI